MFSDSAPLALDPLGPMEPGTDDDSRSDPLALDPLSPIERGRIGADDSEQTSE
jgi:hypothetical protein